MSKVKDIGTRRFLPNLFRYFTCQANFRPALTRVEMKVHFLKSMFRREKTSFCFWCLIWAFFLEFCILNSLFYFAIGSYQYKSLSFIFRNFQILKITKNGVSAALKGAKSCNYAIFPRLSTIIIFYQLVQINTIQKRESNLQQCFYIFLIFEM